MAAPAFTVADLQVLIQALQAQNALLQAALSAAPAAFAADVVTFADTPQMLNTDDLLDYSTKRGSSIYEQGCKALDDKALAGVLGMTTDQMVVFVDAISCCATAMGWNKGTKQITTFANRGGTPVDLIKCYGQINETTLQLACERFRKAGEADAESCAKQNNTMMAICLASSLTAKAQARCSPTAMSTLSMVWSMHLFCTRSSCHHQLRCHHADLAREPSEPWDFCSNS
jgi:hypothetical protein